MSGPPLDVYLETNLSPFMGGSSLSHVDMQAYTKTRDFLMRARAQNGFTLSGIVARHGTESPLGPRIIAILEALGWPINEKLNRQEREFEEVHIDEGSDVTSGGSMVGVGITVLMAGMILSLSL